MATQSQIQSALQGGLGLQTMAQNNAPAGPNTGNPNTVYNLSPPNVRVFDPATGALPPMGDAFGNWAVPAIPTTPNTVDPRLLQLLSNVVQQTQVRPVVPTGPMPTIPPIVIPGLTPPPAPPEAPPLQPPPSVAPLPPPTPVTDPSLAVNPNGNNYNAGGGWSATTGVNQGGAYHFNPGNPGVAGATGGGEPINWSTVLNGALQGLDAVTEPFLPGNWFLSGSGKLDLSNALAGLATRYGIPANQILGLMTKTPTQAGLSLISGATGLPLAQLAGLLNIGQGGESIADRILGMGDQAPASLRWLQDHFLDNLQNGFDVFQRDTLSSTNARDAAARDADITRETLERAGIISPSAGQPVHQFGGGYGGSAVGGFAFNSNPYASAVEGDAARAMMEGMSGRGGGMAGTGVPGIDNYIDLM